MVTTFGANPMINPFQYGGIVGKDAFCNRKKELKDIMSAMENGEKIFVYSEKRMAKTSLVQLAMSRLPQRSFLCAYVDLWPTDVDRLLAELGDPLDVADRLRGDESLDEDLRRAALMVLLKRARPGD